MSSIQIPAKRRRATVTALASVAAAALLLPRLWTGPTERLLELPVRPYGQVLGVYGGELYYREPRPAAGGMVIHAVPVRGGTPRQVVHDQTAPANVSEISLTPSGVYYRFSDPDLPASTVQPRFFPPPAPGRSGVRWRIGSDRPGVERLWSRIPRMHLRHASLAGGEARELVPEIRAVELRVSGDYCYWLRSELIAPGPPLRRPEGKPPVNELMVSPLAGGPAHRIAFGVGTLQAGADGVFWEAQQGRTRVPMHTYPPDFPIQALEPHAHEPGLTLPVQAGGRLYWAASAEKDDRFGLKPRHQLISSLPDGTDLQVVLDVDPQGQLHQTVGRLESHGSDLLFVRDVPGPPGKLPFQVLCRLRPGESKPRDLTPPIQGVEMGEFWLDGDYAYFRRAETQENWLDWSAKGLTGQRVTVLHRVRVIK